MEQPTPRTPRFLASVPAKSPPRAAPFTAPGEAPKPRVPADPPQSRPPSEPPLSLLDPPSSSSNTPAPAPVAPAPPPPGPVSVHPSVASFPPEARNHDAIAARYRAAIDALRLESQRLAEQARADAVEIAFQVARKLLEAELSANPERLFGLVRQAIQKLGDARRVTLRVCQADLNALKSEHGQAELAHTGVASVEIVADPKLGPGDCVIESPVGAVDGRLSVRLAEVRRSVAEALEEEAA